MRYMMLATVLATVLVLTIGLAVLTIGLTD
jgi:hypothetical protein